MLSQTQTAAGLLRNDRVCHAPLHRRRRRPIELPEERHITATRRSVPEDRPHLQQV